MDKIEYDTPEYYEWLKSLQIGMGVYLEGGDAPVATFGLLVGMYLGAWPNVNNLISIFCLHQDGSEIGDWAFDRDTGKWEGRDYHIMPCGLDYSGYFIRGAK